MDKQYYITDAIQGFGTGWAAAAAKRGSGTKAVGYELSGMQANFEGIMAQMAMEEKRAVFLQGAEKLHSRQITQAAAAGLQLDSQSFQAIQAETMNDYLREANRMRNQGEIYRLAGEAKAQQSYGMAQLTRAQGRAAFWEEIIKGGLGMTKMWADNGRLFGQEGEDKDWPHKHEAYEPDWNWADFRLEDIE